MKKGIEKIIIVLSFCFFSCQPGGQTGSDVAGINDFSLPSIDGGNVTLSSLKGHVILLDFWATWCPPCRNSIPVFVKLYNKYHDQGFTVLGIGLEEEDKLRNYRDEHNIPYPILVGNKDVAKTYEVQAIPKILILDKKGKIRKTQVGFAPEVEAMFDAFIDSLLKEGS